MDCGSDEVNVLLDVSWDTVVFTSEMLLAVFGVGVDVVVGLEQRLGFFDSHIELDPG